MTAKPAPDELQAAFEKAMTADFPEAPRKPRSCGVRRMLLINKRFGIYVASMDYCDRSPGHEGRHSSFWRAA